MCWISEPAPPFVLRVAPFVCDASTYTVSPAARGMRARGHRLRIGSGRRGGRVHLLGPPRSDVSRLGRKRAAALRRPLRRTDEGGGTPPAPSAYHQARTALKKVFAVDVLACPDRGGRLKLIALIAEATVARRILDHLGLDSQGPPVARSQAPPELLDPGPDYDVADPTHGD